MHHSELHPNSADALVLYPNYVQNRNKTHIHYILSRTKCAWLRTIKQNISQLLIVTQHVKGHKTKRYDHIEKKICTDYLSTQ